MIPSAPSRTPSRTGSVYSLMDRIFELGPKRALEMGEEAAFKKD